MLSGLTFTSLRLLQLGLALSARDAAGTHPVRPPLVRGLLWAGVALWAANAVFLASTVMVTPPRP